MANYKESSVTTGQSWTRCARVVCENPHEGQRAITFVEEDIVSVPGRTISTASGNLVELLSQDNAMESFDLLHPETGAVLGQSSYQAAYVLLHSLYMYCAIKRDAQQ